MEQNSWIYASHLRQRVKQHLKLFEKIVDPRSLDGLYHGYLISEEKRTFEIFRKKLYLVAPCV